jgi:hypothetical protein
MHGESAFSNVINSYQFQLADDEENNNPIFSTNIASSSWPSTSTTPQTLSGPEPDFINILPLIPISQLFNYDNSAWVKLISEGAERSATVELALYDLLNSGWSSQACDDALFKVDATTEQLLMS